MFCFDKSKLSEFNLNDIESFITFWGKFYKPDEDIYFKSLNIGGEIDKDQLKTLLRWKDKQFLTEKIKSGQNEGTKNNRVTTVVKHLADINKLRKADFRKIDEVETLEKNLNIFKSGNGVWNIFLKHIANPIYYPIFDQHVNRAYCCLKNKDESKIKENYKGYREFFFSIYEKIYGSIDFKLNLKTIENMKKIDNGLMTYGQFLNDYGTFAL